MNINESQLRTIEKIEQFPGTSGDVAITAYGGEVARYAHISRVFKLFDYPRCQA